MRAQFFSDQQVLAQKVRELISRAEVIEIAVARAGKSNDIITELPWKERDKVRKFVVGTSLHNTNPKFLERWQGGTGFKVETDLTEIFHPRSAFFDLRVLRRY